MNFPSLSRFWLQIALAVLTCAIGSVSAQTSGTFGNFYYEDLGTAITVTGYVTEPVGEMVIPETINNKPVTRIGDWAFSRCSGLTSVTIPDSVTRIGLDAFWLCDSLDRVTIGNGVTNIGDGAFSSCSGLTSVTIGNSVASIGYRAFLGCIGLTSLSFPDSVTSIGTSAFSGCSGLTSLTFPNSLTSIGDGAFSGCSGLTSLTFPDSLTSIGTSAFSGCSGLTSLSFPDSLTSIGTSAFSNCIGLTSLTFPDSLTSIGTSAFSGCSGLISLSFPNSLTSIGDGAFSGCIGLTSLSFPDSLTSIGTSAFSNCSGLSSLTFPDSLTSIGTSAFSGCSELSSVEFLGNAPVMETSVFENAASNFTVYYHSGKSGFASPTWNGYPSAVIEPPPTPTPTPEPTPTPLNITFIEDEETIMIFGYVVEPIGHLEIPASINGKPVTSIREFAFYECSRLTSVTIPDSVTSIGNDAFAGCIGLTSVTIPNSVTSIGKWTFWGCSGLTSLTLPDSLTSIGNEAFANCSGLTSLPLPNSLTSIGTFAFAGCSGLTSLTLPNSVTSIGEGAFYKCSGLTSLTLPNSVTSTGNWAFSECIGLTSVTIPDGVASIGDYAFSGCSGLTSVTIGNSVISIGGSAFYNCIGLTSVTLPDSVTSIGSWAFKECIGLTSVTIGNSVISIGGSAFYNCIGLTSVTLPDSVTSIGEQAFFGCSGLTSLTIPDSVTNIGKRAFYGCSGLTSVEFLGNAPQMGDEVFNNAAEGFTIYCQGTGFSSPTWLGYPSVAPPPPPNINFTDAGGTITITGYVVKPTGHLEIPAIISGKLVTSIGDYAFSGCSGLTSVTIPNSVTSIGDSAFSRCIGLTSVTIGNSVISIGDSAFAGCIGLTSVTIPDSVTSIGGAFWGCSGLTSVTIPDSVTSIGGSAFAGCSGLTSVTIPDSVTSIGGSAFEWCSGLTSVTIPNSVTSIGKSAFYKCSGLTSVTIGNSVTSIGDSAFGECSGLTSLTIGSSVTSIGKGAFFFCSGLTSVTIPDSITSIGDSAFFLCSGLTSAEFLGNAPVMETSVVGVFGATASNFTVYYHSGKTGFTSPTWNGYPAVNIDLPTPTPTPTPEPTPTPTPEPTPTPTPEPTPTPTPTPTPQFGDFTYGVNPDNTVEILSYKGSELSVSIPSAIEGKTVTSIGAKCFNSTDVEQVTIPAGVTSIGEQAFLCWWLESISVDPENPSYSSADGVLFNKAKTILIQCPGGKDGNYTVPASVTTIGQFAFKYCELTQVTIPAAVTSIGEQAFDSCWWLESINVAPENPSYSSEDGVLFNKAKTTLLQFPCAKTGSYTVPASVKAIEKFAFEDSEVEQVIMPTGLVSIGVNAFAYCYGLKSIVIPDTVTSIGKNAFRQIAITSITIPSGITEIPYAAFGWCENLRKVVIPASVTLLDEYAFAGCTNLLGVLFQGTPPEAGENLFWGSTPTVYYPSGTSGWDVSFAGRPTAVWNPSAPPVVTLDSAGGGVTPSSKSVDLLEPYGELPVAVRGGFSFGGWWTGVGGQGTEVTATTLVINAENHTLYAKWIPPVIVQFDPEGGMVGLASKEVFPSAAYGTLPIPVRTGYTFGGWWTGVGGQGTEVTAEETVANGENHTLYAMWTPSIYTLVFDLGGGYGAPSSGSVTFQSTYGELPTPTREGFTFGGWWTEANGGGGEVNADMTVTTTANHTLYAKWLPNSYVVSFYSEVTEEFPQQTIVFDSSYGTLPSPTKTGYTFGGWWTGWDGSGIPVNETTKVFLSNDHTLYAKWTPNQYVLTFDPAGGAVFPAQISVTFGSNYGTLPTPTRAGYTFSHWYAESAGNWVSSWMPVQRAEDHTLSAYWHGNYYQVTLIDPEGNLFSVESYLYGQPYGNTGLPAKTYVGYDNGGYWTGPNGTGTHITESTILSIPADHVLYAQRIPRSNTVSFYAAPGTVSPESKVVTFGSPYGQLPIPVRPGYSFGGWWTDFAGTGQRITSRTIVTTWQGQFFARWSDSPNEAPIATKSSPQAELVEIKEGASQSFNLTASDSTDPNSATKGMVSIVWFVDGEQKQETKTGAPGNISSSFTLKTTATTVQNAAFRDIQVVALAVDKLGGELEKIWTVRVFNVPAAQRITFGALPVKALGDPDFLLGATASSELPVEYSSSNPSVAIITEGVVHLVGLGTTVITASQPGNSDINPALPVKQTLTVKARIQVESMAGGSVVGGGLYAGGSTAILTAKPGKGMIFKQWLKNGESFSRDARLVVSVGEGMMLVPEYIPNPYPEVKDTYNALAGDGNLGTGSEADRSAFFKDNGFVTMTTTDSGSFTGVLRLEGKKLSLRGQFDGYGEETLTLKRKGKSDATVAMKFDTTVPGKISGNVSTDGSPMDFIALPGQYSGVKTDVHPLSGKRYTVLLPAPEAAYGHGYATLVVVANGKATFAGKLADRTTFSTSARTVDDGSGNWVVPVHIPLYTGLGGMIWGEVLLPEEEPAGAADVVGGLGWLRPADTKTKLFAEGFLEALEPKGERYGLVQGVSLFSGSATTAGFTLAVDPSGTVLGGALRQGGTWSATNKPMLTLPVDSKLKLSFTGKTGVFKGTFSRMVSGKAVITAYEGVVLGNELTLPGESSAIRGGGFFSTDSASGQVEVIVP